MAHAASDIAQPASSIECSNPATREKLGTVHVTSADDVRDVVTRARTAQRRWAETSFAERKRVLRRLLETILDRVDFICDEVVQDSGKTRENAVMGEVWPVCEKLRWTINNGEKHLRPESVSSGLFLHKSARIEYVPRGVIAGITPWNYPFQNLMNPIIPSLMAGNAVVIKPSEWVAWSTSRLLPLVTETLEAMGHSADLVQVVQGYGETGRALIEARVDAIVFIGSLGNGRRVLEAAAKNVTPVVLELGGKDPFIVCEDADLEQAAHAALSGCFINCGQNCVAAERILVLDDVYPAFESKLAALTGELKQGVPSSGTVDLGAMATPLQLDIVERLVRSAVKEGARVVTGGKRVLAESGEFYAPTILADVTPDMRIMREETFGPVMLLCRVRDEEHAIDVANSTSYGLSSSVFSRDLGKARRIASRLEAGTTAINEFGGAAYMVQDLPFGGIKDSGYGRLNGRDGLRALCHPKSILDDRLPMTFANKVFPTKTGDYERTKAAIRLTYGGFRRRARGLFDVFRTRSSAS